MHGVGSRITNGVVPPARRRVVRSPDSTLRTTPATPQRTAIIEMAFAKLKALLRAKAIRTVEALWNALGSLAGCFAPAECANFFRHDGYFQSP